MIRTRMAAYLARRQARGIVARYTQWEGKDTRPNLRSLVIFAEAMTGLSITLEAISGQPTGISGLTVRVDDSVRIIYSEDRGRWHSELVICHELAHVLLGHLTVDDPSPTAMMDPGLFSELPIDRVRNALAPVGITVEDHLAHDETHRSYYDETDEYAAEFLGSQLLVLLLMDSGEFQALQRARLHVSQQNVLDTFLGPE